MSARKILFIDDDPGVLKTADLLLRKAGFAFRGATGPAEAYSLLAVEKPELILLDLNFSRAQISGEEGLECLREILRHDPQARVVVVTGHSGLNIAVQALRAGAKNFIMKPWNNGRLIEAIEEVLSQVPSQSDFIAAEASSIVDSGMVVGSCDALLRVKALIGRYASLTAPILIMGEVGTGKSLVAQALHRHSGRSDLRVIDASALLITDLTELTNTTLVLEDIDKIDPAHTMSVTTWLQNAARHNSRLIATTLRRHPEIGLPKSLLYALSTLEITLPPLRERGDDIELLADHFSRIFAIRQKFSPRSLSSETIAALRSLNWEDNLHALRWVIERAVATADGNVITTDDLDLSGKETANPVDLSISLERSEKFVIEKALNRNNFNISKAALELGLTRQTLYRRMARHGL